MKRFLLSIIGILGCWGLGMCQDIPWVIFACGKEYPDSVKIDGTVWTCNGRRDTPKGVQVSYICYPGDNEAVERTFRAMTLMLATRYSEGRSSLGENTRVFYAIPDEDDADSDCGGAKTTPLQILLLKALGSDAPDSWLKKGYVSFDIRPY